MNKSTTTICERCQASYLVDPDAPTVCPECGHTPEPEPPQAPPPIPAPPQPLTEAQMTVQLLTKIHDKVSVMQVIMIIWFAVSVFGWFVQIIGATNGRRW